jgi:TonB family protein
VESTCRRPHRDGLVWLRESDAAPGLLPTNVQSSGTPIYLHPDVLATHAEIVAAAVVRRNGRPAVEVRFLKTAADRLSSGSRAHLGKPLAMFIDGRVVAAPILTAAIDDTSFVPGPFTQPEAQEMAIGLAPGSSITRPRPTALARPSYSPEAQSAGIQGVVLLQVVVKSDGTVGDVVLTRSLDTVYGLDRAAVDAIKKWRFTPGMKDGTAVPMQLTITLEFTLSAPFTASR